MPGGKEQEKATDINAYTDQYNMLTKTFLKRCCAEAEGKNVVISPLSILLLLSMAADSTAGRTREEILSFLGHPEANLLIAKLQEMFKYVQSLSVANAVFVRNEIAPTIRNNYKEKQLPVYNARLFSSDDPIREINSWVYLHTHGIIQDAVPDSIRNMLMCLISADAFESAWESPYRSTTVRDGEFRNANESKSTVKMLYGTEQFFIESNDFTGFIKSYEDHNISFMALLPKKEGQAAMAEALERINYAELCRSAFHAIVHTQMPEFRFEFEKELTELCRSFGIKDLFSKRADFSPVSSSMLIVNSILHKARIDVSQKGTQAAAFTTVHLMGGRPPKETEVTLDRPFVFAIMNNETGIPVFTGVVNDLEEITKNGQEGSNTNKAFFDRMAKEILEECSTEEEYMEAYKKIINWIMTHTIKNEDIIPSST